MHRRLAGIAAFLRPRARRLRLVFLSVVLLSVLYYVSWRMWWWSHVPGMILVDGSLPWSWPWLAFGFRSDLMTLQTYDVITLIVVSVGFGLNCTILYGVILWWQDRAKR